MIVIVMGVAGSGKTTIGKLLAQNLDWEFRDGDDFHPTTNVAKMRSGKSRSDAEFLQRAAEVACIGGVRLVRWLCRTLGKQPNAVPPADNAR